MTQNLDRFQMRWWNMSFMTKVVSLDVLNSYAVVENPCTDDFTPNKKVQLSTGILMQSTGLRDIKNNLIYEGDVVKWGHLEGSKENPVRVAVVEINPDIQFRRLDISAKQGFLGQNYIFRFGSFAYTHTHKCLEIVGNIYENPELLTTNE